MSRKRVTLYFDADVYDRTLVACRKLGSNVSEYLRDYMAANLEALELAANTSDPKQVAEAFQRQLGDVMAFQLEQAAELLRNIQAVARGEEIKE